MDKNQFIGLILMFALLAVYFTWFAPEPPIIEESQEAASAAQPVQTDSLSAPSQKLTQLADSLWQAQNRSTFGAFAFALSEEETETSVENDDLKITFTSKGGRIKQVIMKNHKDHLGEDFELVGPDKSSMNFTITHNAKPLKLDDLQFQTEKEERSDTTLLTFTLKGEHFLLQHIYSIPAQGFEIGFQTLSQNLNAVLDPVDIAYQWNHTAKRAERTLEDSRRNANVRYYQTNGEYDELSETSEDFEEQNIATQLSWVSFKQKFFAASILSERPFSSGYVSQKVDFADSSSIKAMSMALAIPYSDYISGLDMKYYFGTTQYNTLKTIAPEFERNLDMGWGPLPIVNKFLIIPIFNVLRGFMSNYGLIIIIIVVIVRLILSPLTYKSHMSMAKMRVMKPELDALKEKLGDDMQKVQQEQMKLYQQVGINPLSGCIPLLFQMPILFSLFFFFPNAVELRGQSFLWAHDLSTYDSILDLPFAIPFYGSHVSLFTLLMTLSTLATIWSNSQVSASVQGPMKTIQYFMPVMMLFFLNNYASGLTFYYFVSNMVTFGQTVLFRKLIDEDKIHQILQENKKKNANKKKSKFQQRLEDAMKASQEAQRNNKKKPKKK